MGFNETRNDYNSSLDDILIRDEYQETDTGEVLDYAEEEEEETEAAGGEEEGGAAEEETTE